MQAMLESLLSDNHMKLLKLLKQSRRRYVSGETISRKAHVSRVSIWKYVSALRKYGYKIESKEGSGYKLVGTSDKLLPWEIRDGLKTRFLGREIHHYQVLDSTQDVATRLAEDGAAEGTVVIAESQRRGRARIGRKWVAPEGGIWLSLILRPKIPAAECTILPLVAALGVCNAIRKELELDAGLKWPNDIMINNRKASGILAEMSCEADRINYVIIGIGVDANISRKKLETTIKGTAGYYGATSLMDELGKKIDRVKLARSMLMELERSYIELEKEGSAAIIQAWKERSATLGSPVSVTLNEVCFVGKAVDLDYDGALLVKLQDGSIKRIVAGDVYVRMVKPKNRATRN